MRLHVEVLEGQDLLRAPYERCRAGSMPRGKRRSFLPRRRRLSGSDAPNADEAGRRKSAIDTVRRLADKIKSPLGTTRGGERRKSEKGEASRNLQGGKPFVSLRLKDTEQTTALGSDATRATWNETFVFDVTGLWGAFNDAGFGVDEQELELEIDVKDSVKCLSYGHVSIPLGRLSSATRIKQWYQLTRPDWCEADGQEESSMSSLDVSGVEDEDEEVWASDRESGSVSSLREPAAAATEDSCGVLLLSLHFEDDGAEAALADGPGEDGPRLKARRDRRAAKKDAVRSVPCRLADYVVLGKLGDGEWEGSMLERFPSEADQHEDLPLPDRILSFMFPFEQGISSERAVSDGLEVLDGVTIEYFAFALCPVGVSLYGFCLLFRDITKENTSTQGLCIVSRLNAGDMFRELLIELTQLALVPEPRISLAQAARRLVYGVPMPLPGALRVRFDVVPGANQYELSLPRLGDLPPLTFENGIALLLNKLGTGLLVELWGALLLNYSVVMHAQSSYLLSIAGETLKALLYPLWWVDVYVPVNPSLLLENVQTPVPFILGFHSKLVREIPEFDLSSVLLLDLDRGVVRKGVDIHIEPLPAAEHRRLVRMINHAVGLRPCALDDPLAGPLASWNGEARRALANCLTAEQTRQVRLCFVECLCQMLQGYRSCLFFLNESMPVFNAPKFLERCGPDTAFYTRFLQTNTFATFEEMQLARALSLFNAYFFRVRIRDRNRDQYLALGSQKRHAHERRRAAEHDPDEDDFDSEVRNRSRTQNQVLLQRRDARNVNVWAARDRRSFLAHSEGLDPLAVDLNDEEEEEGDEEPLTEPDDSLDEQKCLECLASPDGAAASRVADGCEGGPWELGKVGAECGADPGRLRSALRDLRRMIGTHNYSMDAQRAASETESSEEESEEEGAEGAGGASAQQGAKRRYSRRARRASSIARSIATYDADNSRRGARDRVVEKDLQQCIKRIFLNQGVEHSGLSTCGEHFLASKHARDLFVLILFQPHHRHSGLSHSTKGRGLRQEAFEALVYLCRALLDACARKEDYRNARQMLELSQSYYLDRSAPEPSGGMAGGNAGNPGLLGPDFMRTASTRAPHARISPEARRRYSLEARRRSFAEAKQAIPVAREDYLEAHLRELAIWQTLLFWEDAFAELLGNEAGGSRARAATAAVESPTPLEGEEGEPLGDEDEDGHIKRIGTSDSRLGERRRRTDPSHPRVSLLASSNTGASARSISSSTSSTSSGQAAGGAGSAAPRSGLSDAASAELARRQEVLFELATSTAYRMIHIGASEDKAKALVSRIVTQHGLDEEHEETLCTLISNLSKAVELTTQPW